VAEGGVGQTFKTGDKKDLIEKLQQLLTGEDLKSMNELGRKKVEANYAKENILKKLLDIYKSL
jgi:glycosyltransferase involved in cell wall biosynthesis